VEGRVVGKRQWTNALYSLQVSAPGSHLYRGPVRAPCAARSAGREGTDGRASVFVRESPARRAARVLFHLLPDGPLSPRLAALDGGDAVWMLPRANGFFTISELPESESLWCISTGTGIGPFLSMLRTDEPWQKFARVVLVHSVRVRRQSLPIATEIAAIGRTFMRALSAYVPMVEPRAVA
jgi:ferredoxin--NADP+ reductase